MTAPAGARARLAKGMGACARLAKDVGAVVRLTEGWALPLLKTWDPEMWALKT